MKGLDVMPPPAEPTLPDDPELHYLSLGGLLPEAHRLALQPDLGLVAHFSSTRVSERVIERMREQAYEARESGEWDALMCPMRNVLSRVRLKLRPFGIKIVSLVEVGYALVPTRPRGRETR